MSQISSKSYRVHVGTMKKVESVYRRFSGYGSVGISPTTSSDEFHLLISSFLDIFKEVRIQ
jgi:hypothetical protein